MALYVIMAVSDPEKMGQAVRENFPEKDVLELQSGQWLVSADVTVQAMSQTLGLMSPGDKPASTVGMAMVARLESYWGYHDKAIWDWMALRERR